MADTQSYYETQLTTIDAKIDAILANPRPNYRVGSVSYSMADLLETLYEVREKILQNLRKIPTEEFETLQTDVNPFGADLTDYINED